jgi:hypothetical protein
MRLPLRLMATRPRAILLSAALAACALLTDARAQTPSEALIQWLQFDCEEGNLQAVIRFRQAVVPGLIAALENGPPDESRERVRKAAEASYDELIEQARRKPERRVASRRDAYVNRNVENFDAQYRVRAGQALAALGTPEARQALERALNQVKREDVRSTIEALLNKPPR